jgi:hypothetical protein
MNTNNIISDRFGRNLHIGQKCIYIQAHKGGYNLYKAVITSFTLKSVKIQTSYTHNTTVSSHSLIILSEESIDWKDLYK